MKVAIKTIRIDEENWITVKTDDSVVVDVKSTDREGLLPKGAEPVSAKQISDASLVLRKQIDGLAALGRTVLSSATPSKLELHAEIMFAGSAGIPILATAGAEASLKLVLTWENEGRGS